MQGIARYKGFIQCMSDYGIKYDDDCIRWYSTREMEDKFSKKGLAHIYRHTRDCTALLIYNDEVAMGVFGVPGRERDTCSGRSVGCIF